MPPHSSRGFTLIELLVVIAVIGILMGVALGVGQRARASGHAITCSANLRQVGHALSLYIGHHFGYIPRRGQGDRKLYDIGRMSDWFNCLMPDLGSAPYWQLVAEGRQPAEGGKHPLVCPSARDVGHIHFMPYGMNIYLSPWKRPRPHRLAELPHPATLVFMTDSPSDYCATMPTAKAYGLEARHAGRANVAFLDGHVRAFSGSYLGCGRGDPKHGDVRWETESEGVNWRTR